MQWIHELEQHAVAFARLDGALVDCNRPFRKAVLGDAEAELKDGNLLACFQLSVDDIELGPRGEKRRVETQLARSCGVHVALTISSAHTHGSGLLRIELEDETPRVTAERQFTWILESSFDGYWDWHIKDDYEYMSPQFWRMFGYEPHEKEHKPSAWQDMVNQDDLKEALVNFAKHIETRGEHAYLQEVRYTHKNGSTVWVRCKGRVVEYDDQGGAVRMVGTHTDITKLKEEQLKQRELSKVVEEQNKRLQRRANEMHGLVYRANAPVIGFDTAGRITEWNHRVAELTGKEEADVVGLPLSSLKICRPESLEAVELILRNSSAGKRVNNQRISLCCEHEAVASVDILANSSVRRDASGKVACGGFLLGQDLTEVMIAKNDAVSAACETRAEKRLNEYMAHEVRNPVFSAQAAAELLADFLESPAVAAIPDVAAAASDAKLIVNSLDYVFELLTSLLDLNKFLEGSLKYEVRPVNFVDRVLSPVMAMVRRRAAGGVAVSFECDRTLEGLCDETRIKQVVMNLVSNSLKFTHSGFVRVFVEKDGDQLFIRVEDSGVGVPPESASKLFKRFSQGAGQDQGSGIGLYLSRLVVMRIGGELWLDQSYTADVDGAGPGSRFCVRIPFPQSMQGFESTAAAAAAAGSDIGTTASAMASDNANNSSTSAINIVLASPALAESEQCSMDASERKNIDAGEEESKQADEESTGVVASKPKQSGSKLEAEAGAGPGSVRLLLVDDDVAVRMVMGRLLKRAHPSVEVTQAVCGEEAVKRIEEGAVFDVIIMDQHMNQSGGKILGTDAIQMLREMGCEALIIGLSGNDVAAEYLDAGADLAWRKPMMCRQTIRSDIIDGLARRQQSRRAARA